jgi:hypothetical protein
VLIDFLSWFARQILLRAGMVQAAWTVATPCALIQEYALDHDFLSKFVCAPATRR